MLLLFALSSSGIVAEVEEGRLEDYLYGFDDFDLGRCFCFCFDPFTSDHG